MLENVEQMTYPTYFAAFAVTVVAVAFVVAVAEQTDPVAVVGAEVGHDTEPAVAAVVVVFVEHTDSAVAGGNRLPPAEGSRVLAAFGALQLSLYTTFHPSSWPHSPRHWVAEGD